MTLQNQLGGISSGSIRVQVHILGIRQTLLEPSENMFHSLFQEVPSIKEFISETQDELRGATLHRDHHCEVGPSVGQA